MKFKSTIKKLIVPKFEPLGYEFSAPGGVNYFFSNEAEKKRLNFDANRFLKGQLRIEFWEQINYNGEDIRFNFSYLRPEFFPYKLEYASQETFDESFITLADKIIEIILPYGDVARENYVYVEQEMYSELAIDTVGRAKRFSEKWNLSLNEEGVHQLQGVIALLQTGRENRKRDFERHRSEVIDMAAFFGEALNTKYGLAGKWYWRDDCSATPFYATVTQGYDVLRRTIDAWNMGGEVINYGLDCFPI